jgi:hypothetical protein
MSPAAIVRLLAVLAVSACSSGSLGDRAVGPSGSASGGGMAGGPEPTAYSASFMGGAPKVDLQTQAACRERANEIWEQQDRAEIYKPNSSVNTPFSANWEPDVPSRGLADQFAYGKTVADCERESGGGSEQSNPIPASPRSP